MAEAKSSCRRSGWPVGLLRQALGTPRDTVCAGGGDRTGGTSPHSQEGGTDGSPARPSPNLEELVLGRGEAGPGFLSLRSSRLLDHGGGCGQEGMTTRSDDICLHTRWKPLGTAVTGIEGRERW